MATLDGYAPYATGMTAREAVDALWAAKNISTTSSTILYADDPPAYSAVKNDVTFWYNTSTNKLYRANLNNDLSIVIWIEV